MARRLFQNKLILFYIMYSYNCGIFFPETITAVHILARDYRDVRWNQFSLSLDKTLLSCRDGIFFLAIILPFRDGMLCLGKALLHRDEIVP